MPLFVNIMILICFAMFLAFLNTDTFVFDMILAFLSAATLVLH